MHVRCFPRTVWTPFRLRIFGSRSAYLKYVFDLALSSITELGTLFMKSHNFNFATRLSFRWLTRSLVVIAFCAGAIASRLHADPIIYTTSYKFTNNPLDTQASTFYRVDATTGAPTFIGAIGFSSVDGIDFDSAGTLYGIGQRLAPGDPLDRTPVLLTINPNTGAGTEIAAIKLASNGLNLDVPVQDISFRNSDGALYAYATGDTYTINKITGVATLVGSSGIAAPPQGGGTAFSPTDKLITISQTLVLTTNQATGQLLAPPSLATYPELSSYATGMDFDNSTGKLWATVTIDPQDILYGQNYLANIDADTGIVTRVGNLQGELYFRGLTVAPVAPAVIPEPGSALVGLLALGMCFCGLLSRSRRLVVGH